MNRIRSFDDATGIVEVEPGVTFSQLAEQCRQRGGVHMLSVTSSSGDSSVLGNVLERGVAVGPDSDRAAHAHDFEIVLGDGSVIHTGASRFSGVVGSRENWLPGPSLAALFTQSNFGIVTGMRFDLSWTPPVIASIHFTTRGDRVAGAVEAMAWLKRQLVIRGRGYLGNGYRSLAGRMRYPWLATRGKTPFTAKQLHETGELIPSVRQWSGSMAIYAATDEIAAAQEAAVVRHLRPVSSWISITDTTGSRIHSLSANRWRMRRVRGIADDPRLSILRGFPSERPLGVVYWRKRERRPAGDPDRDAVGLIWVRPTVPLVGTLIEELTDAISEECLRCGFEPLISVLAVDERTALISLPVTWDRQTPGEDERAMLCHERILELCRYRGYLPHRLTIDDFARLPPIEDSTARFIREIKAAADPDGIISPGRYEP